jgi:hypothetical protein
MMIVASAIGVLGTGAGAFFLTKKGERKDQKNCYSPLQSKIAVNDTCVDMATKIVVPVYYTLQNSLVQLSPQRYIDTGEKVVSERISYGNRLQCTCVSGQEAQDYDSVSSAQCYEMSCTLQYSGQLFLEAAGGRGGSYSYYDLDAKLVTYEGGAPGVAYVTLDVASGDILLVKFGYDSTGSAATQGGGGAGTPASSSGGGATQVFHNGKLVLVGAGGGGASKNATGGHGGSSGVPQFGIVHPVTNGQPGGTLFRTTNDVAPSTQPNDLSGGGGDSTEGGIGVARGSSLQGGNAIESQYGGGGGGSGYYGGAAGAWNTQLKPFNLHGGGGGGSSYTNGFFPSGTEICPYDRGTNAPTSSYVTFGYPIND